ncbi:MAG TPA: hypothetical protein VE912_20535 [Bacteroidales bacterium]|nr:hypothetical protein [Bacteroidales bacterium]
MKTRKIYLMILLISSGLLLSQCERYGGGRTGFDTKVDEDSDRPAWAGGNTDANNHIKGNDESGTTRGGDYGDLYVLLRTDNGVPIMKKIDSVLWVVQPVDESNAPLALDAEGELVNPEAAIEVDFGRLNIVRSPQSVLDQAFGEAMKTLTQPGAVITLDFCGRLTSNYFDAALGENVSKTIDSPRENMAIYQYLMRYMFEDLPDGSANRLSFLKQYGFDPMLISASCLAAGSDKTGTISIDEVVYINGFIDAVGLNPILNKHDYDFNHDSTYYWNFGDCDGTGKEFNYDREGTYGNRYVQFLVWDNTYYPVDEYGHSNGPVYSLWRLMEGKVSGVPQMFTYRWGDMAANRVSGFMLAADDAVQVLDFVHGDSNIRFLPDYTPAP